MNVLVLLSHNNHQFILNELKYASSSFEKVYLVCPKNEIFETFSKKYENLIYIGYKKCNKFKQLLISAKAIDSNIFGEIKTVIKQRKISFEYFKILFGQLFDVSLFYSITKKIFLKCAQTDKITVMSCWFTASAYACYKLKKKYPNITVGSLAHAFEIDDSRNRFVDNLFMKQKQNGLDFISFISKNVLNKYILRHVLPNCWRMDNLSVRYLGAVKTFNCFSNDLIEDKHTYTIVTNSNVIKLKRLDLLAKALQYINDMNIQWIHFGGGKETDAVLSEARKCPPNILIDWKGVCSNDSIQKFYCDNIIDAFLNISTTEGIPVSIMEALAYGIPCIATDVGGNSEIVTDDVGKLISSNITPIELAMIMKNFLKENKSKYRENAMIKFNVFNADIIRPEFYLRIRDNGSDR